MIADESRCKVLKQNTASHGFDRVSLEMNVRLYLYFAHFNEFDSVNTFHMSLMLELVQVDLVCVIITKLAKSTVTVFMLCVR